MSEELKRDPLLRELARLQPLSAGVDRDAMLFACGRASAPKHRAWKVAAAALLLVQLTTVGLWKNDSRQEAAYSSVVVRQSGQVEPSAPFAPEIPPGSYGGLVRLWQREGLPSPPAINDPMAPNPTWTIATSQQSLGID